MLILRICKWTRTNQQGALSLSSLQHDSMNPSQQDSPANSRQVAEAAKPSTIHCWTWQTTRYVGEMLHLGYLAMRWQTIILPLISSQPHSAAVVQVFLHYSELHSTGMPKATGKIL